MGANVLINAPLLLVLLEFPTSFMLVALFSLPVTITLVTRCWSAILRDACHGSLQFL